MKKRIITFLLALLLVLCTACNTTEKSNVTSSLLHYGDTESSDPLRIYMDIQYYSMDILEIRRTMDDFLYNIRTNLDVDDVVVEFMPNDVKIDGMPDNSERKSAAARLRVEILSGGGPDVFITQYKKTFGYDGYDIDSEDQLIRSPQKLMENGMFLPLDKYIENSAEYTAWDELPQAIMNAGRNEEGQQIIPIAYTLPVMILPREVFDYEPDRLLFWDDMLTDAVLSPYMSDLINCKDYDSSENISGEFMVDYKNDYLEFSLGQLVDYKNGELCFTEEELLRRVRQILAVNQEDVQPDAKESMFSTELRTKYDYPITILPMYSDDGGVSARIDFFAAVNRNTDRPEEAFKVIDTLLSTDMQNNSLIYSNYFCTKYSDFPMNNELINEKNLNSLYRCKDNHEEVAELVGQITTANFDSEISSLLESAFSECISCEALGKTVEEIVHEYYDAMQRRVRE